MEQTLNQFNPEIIKSLKDHLILIIIGNMGSGKSTLLAEISKIVPRKQTHVLSAYKRQLKQDNTLYGQFGVYMIPESKRVSTVIKEIPLGSRLILEDYLGFSNKRVRTINKHIYNLRKMDLQVAYVFHKFHRKITGELLDDDNTLLIIKGKHQSLDKEKLNKYLSDRKMSSGVADFCSKMTGFDTLILFRDGSYYYNGEYGKFEAVDRRLARFTEMHDKIMEEYQADALITHQEIADKVGCSRSTVSSVIKLKDPDKILLRGFGYPVKSPLTEEVELEHGDRFVTTKIYVNHINKIEVGDATGEKKKNIQKVQELQDIGRLASEPIAKILWHIIEDMPDNKKIKHIQLTYNEGEGVDILLTFNHKKVIAIEVKNYKQTHSTKYLSSKMIEERVVERFHENHKNRWLFCCGISPSKKGKKTLEEHKISYVRLTTKQILKLDGKKKKRIYDHLKKWMKGHVLEE